MTFVAKAMLTGKLRMTGWRHFVLDTVFVIADLVPCYQLL